MSQPRPRGLGRGLDALIPMSNEGEAMVPQMIAVDQIRPSRQQVRSRFDAEPLGELAESIRLHGVLQPILVRRLVEGYELIAGERRWRAARLAGLNTVPAVIRAGAGDDEQLVLGLIENLQRTDLDPIEEARGLGRLIEEYGLTHDEVARRPGSPGAGSKGRYREASFRAADRELGQDVSAPETQAWRVVGRAPRHRRRRRVQPRRACE